MVSASYTVHIDTPPSKVWEVMSDVERWPAFAPQFRSIERKDHGPLALGSKAKVTPRGLIGSIWEVTEFEPSRSFTWETNALPGLHLVAGHVVEADGGGARAVLSLASSGPIAAMLSPVLGLVFRRNTRLATAGLKAYCERGVS